MSDGLTRKPRSLRFSMDFSEIKNASAVGFAKDTECADRLQAASSCFVAASGFVDEEPIGRKFDGQRNCF